MSIQYWTVTGFGVNEFDICTSVESQIAFVKRFLPTFYEEMQKDAKDEIEPLKKNNEDNYLDYLNFCKKYMEEYENEQGYRGFGVLFAQAIQTHEEGFDPEYFSMDDYGVIVYTERMPWEMSERVKKMSIDDMSAIFQKYLDILGARATIERQSVTFWG